MLRNETRLSLPGSWVSRIQQTYMMLKRLPLLLH